MTSARPLWLHRGSRQRGALALGKRSLADAGLLGIRSGAVVAALCLALPGCDEDDGAGASSGDPDVPPADAGAIGPWLGERSYTAWAAEPALHPSAGPHFGDVRTYVNPALYASLLAGDEEHPVGAAAVKELYGDGDVVLGHTVMIKTTAGGGGGTWYWYERFEGQVYAQSNGAALCTGCHTPGADYVLTPAAAFEPAP
jgi:hypothetical protein